MDHRDGFFFFYETYVNSQHFKGVDIFFVDSVLCNYPLLREKDANSDEEAKKGLGGLVSALASRSFPLSPLRGAMARSRPPHPPATRQTKVHFL